ncbi:hypothetical protein, partial [Vibrio parahaemolyticus]|uniref:hypothetical protein n=1 Tax=Vibrio parahaemolyticus TaxID=670 RepID=UPI001E528442
IAKRCESTLNALLAAYFQRSLSSGDEYIIMNPGVRIVTKIAIAALTPSGKTKNSMLLITCV